MEFVCEVHDKMDSVTIEQLTISAANVLEKTNVEFKSQSLFRVIISGFFYILSALIDAFK